MNGVVQNGTEKSRNVENRELNHPVKAKFHNTGRTSRPSHPEGAPSRRGYGTAGRDERTDRKANHFDRPRHSHEGRPDSQGPREKGLKTAHLESLSHDKSRLESQAENDRQNYSKLEHNERSEKPPGRGQQLRTQASKLPYHAHNNMYYSTIFAITRVAT